MVRKLQNNSGRMNEINARRNEKYLGVDIDIKFVSVSQKEIVLFQRPKDTIIELLRPE